LTGEEEWGTWGQADQTYWLFNEQRKNAFILERLGKAFFKCHGRLFEHKQIIGAGITGSFKSGRTWSLSRLFISARILTAAVAATLFFGVSAAGGPGPFELLGSILAYTKGKGTLSESADQHLNHDQNAANPRFHYRFAFASNYNFTSARRKASFYLPRQTKSPFDIIPQALSAVTGSSTYFGYRVTLTR
jgi:hypothetical protein